MAKKLNRISKPEPATRIHFIPEWAEELGLEPEDLMEQLGVDKSQVWRWYNKGQLPQEETRKRIADLFGVKPEALLRHPDENWMIQFFDGRQKPERETIKQMMERAWPKPLPSKHS